MGSVGFWAHDEGGAGAEIDLEKAFDRVDHRGARDALLFQGAPEPVVDWLCALWAAPRRCQVAGALSDPVFPVRGLPAGDPASPWVLACFLKPWHARMSSMGVVDMSYIDDRSSRGRTPLRWTVPWRLPLRSMRG